MKSASPKRTKRRMGLFRRTFDVPLSQSPEFSLLGGKIVEVTSSDEGSSTPSPIHRSKSLPTLEPQSSPPQPLSFSPATAPTTSPNLSQTQAGKLDGSKSLGIRPIDNDADSPLAKSSPTTTSTKTSQKTNTTASRPTRSVSTPSTTRILHDSYNYPSVLAADSRYPPLPRSKPIPTVSPPVPQAAPPPSAVRFFPHPFDNADMLYLETKLASLNLARSHSRVQRRTSGRSATSSISRRGSLRGRNRRSVFDVVGFDLDMLAPQRPNTTASGATATADRSTGVTSTNTSPRGVKRAARRATGFGFNYIPPTVMTASQESHLANRATDSPVPIPSPLVQLEKDRDVASIKTIVDGDGMSTMPRRRATITSSTTTVTGVRRASSRLSTNGLRTDQRSSTFRSTQYVPPGNSVNIKLGAETGILQEVVEVYLISNLPEKGFILDHAGKSFLHLKLRVSISLILTFVLSLCQIKSAVLQCLLFMSGQIVASLLYHLALHHQALVRS